MKLKSITLAALCLLICAQASAHNRWILPSHFTLSNDKGEWVMVDVTASNEVFNVDKPMGAERLVITAPDGTDVFPSSSYRGHRKSVVDIHLENSGTYQLKMGGEASYWTSYLAKGEDKKQWLRGVSKAQRAALLPKGATEVETLASYASILSYISLNAPTQNFPLTNSGLELVPVTHPSDIAQGEDAEFKFVFNGKAQAGVKVEIIREGVRYRNNPDSLKLTSDSKGVITFNLKEAGRYLLMAEYETKTANNADADSVSGQIFLTFESVLN
jgi:uncharacterized GH25 family protein